MTNVKEDGQKLVNPVEVLAEAVKTFQRVMVNSQDHVIAAAVARAVSIAAMFPVDTLKTRLQVRLPSRAAMLTLYWCVESLCSFSFSVFLFLISCGLGFDRTDEESSYGDFL